MVVGIWEWEDGEGETVYTYIHTYVLFLDSLLAHSALLPRTMAFPPPNTINEKDPSSLQISISTPPSPSPSSSDESHPKSSTRNDVSDMDRMGKRQELRRNFRFVSIVGFVMVLQSTWESVLLAAQYGLVNGGTAGVIWVTVGVIVGALCMIASIAEMASMYVR